MKKTLDFICIGAAKSATTTLFDLIKDHPDIYIPEDKESSFFNNDEYWKKGFDWYMKAFFGKAKDSDIAGTITPQYMTAVSQRTNKNKAIDTVCKRIKKVAPDVKIIAMLRHPIIRSYSHHKMSRRWGYIDKSFDQSVEEIQNNTAPGKDDITTDNNFLFGSEYGRILSIYYDNFPKQNIMVIFTDELKDNPSGILKKLLNFIGADSSYAPTNISKKSHEGGTEPKIKFLTPGALQKNPIVNKLWSLMPAKHRKKVFYKFVFWNVKKDNERIDTGSDTYKKLVAFFKPDVKKLEKLLGRQAPWDDWKK